jgi:DNA-binding XRE family transcriptional regulator
MLVWTARIRAGRAALRLGQREFALAANIGRSALTAIEMNRSSGFENLYACQMALASGGIEFWELSGQTGFFLPSEDKSPYSAFCLAARAALMATQDQLAAVANIGPRTIAGFERGHPGSKITIEAYLRTLSKMGVEHFAADGRHGLILPTEEQLERHVLKSASPIHNSGDDD